MHVAKWYQLSLAEVAQIRQFSGDEVKKLGDNIAFRLYRVREAVCSTQWGKKSPEICQTLVNREFSDEIGALRAEAKAYSGTKGTSTTEKIVGLVEHLEQPFDCGAHKEKETALCRDELRFEVQPPISKPQQTTKVKKRF
ncbi:hypothetical protein C0993_003665 [Termitomyces sp. T159_Od127]|nr:hypothetical protein C0993_003665 [Termitomyces sp. T159_Od127]